ncbi:hypothetical protein FRC05_011621 [Tulasnella sp. 425]|nr:hypothetical protein FRC05_011621 [Tulasnella sp. 425]
MRGSSQAQATTSRVGLDLEHTDNASDAESTEDEMPRPSNSKLSTLLNLMQDEDRDDPDLLELYHSLARARVEPDDGENDDDEDDDSLEEFRPTLVLQPGMQIFFYDESREYYELSNYAPYPVVYRGKEYPTAEHLFQAKKASISQSGPGSDINTNGIK